MFLVDTNVVSELRKGAKANLGVREFWLATPSEALYLSVQTLGELRGGLEVVRNRGDAPQAKVLEAWLMTITSEFSQRVLPFDEECAEIWGVLLGRNRHNPIDKQIAAVALSHGLTIATRDTGDFEGTGAKVTNPFS